MAKVRKIMLANVPTLKKEARVRDAANLLAKADTGCVVILEGNNPIGIVTERDIVRNIGSKNIGMEGPLSKIMTSPVTFMTPNMKLDQALKIVDTKKFRKYPVVENNAMVGLITKKDIVNAISDNLRLHRNIQNVVLVLFVLFEFFVFVIYSHVYQYLHFGA